jgi:hypothetical protein
VKIGCTCAEKEIRSVTLTLIVALNLGELLSPTTIVELPAESARMLTDEPAIDGAAMVVSPLEMNEYGKVPPEIVVDDVSPVRRLTEL